MLLVQVVQVSQELAATRARLRKAELLAALLTAAAGTADPAAPAAGRDEGGAPRADAPDRAPGPQEERRRRAHGDDDTLAIVLGLLVGRPRQGRIGVGWAGAFGTQTASAESPTLTVAEVDAAFDLLAGIGGSGAQSARSEALRTLFARATEGEQALLRRVLTGEVRHGALEGLVLDGLVQATSVDAALLRRALMLSGDLAETAAVAFRSGDAGLVGIGLRLFRPILPMLAETAQDVGAALALTGPASIEWKLDGLRVQVHKEGARVAVYTRNLNEITSRLPAVVQVAEALPADRLVLDGEALSFAESGLPASFEETMSRASAEEKPDAVPVVPFFFDLLHLDGRDLLDLPLRERWAELARQVPREHLVARVVTDSPEEADAFLAAAKANRHEGVMIKGLDSLYEAGRRGSHWLKVKPVHTLDLVVLAAEWGSGRRQGWLSNLHLGARDPETEGFVMLGKTFKGLTDAMLRWQTERFLEIEVRRTKHVVWVEPVVVVEVAFDGILPSPRYPGGMALRFARVRGYRPDKSATEADTIATVRTIFAASRVREDGV